MSQLTSKIKLHYKLPRFFNDGRKVPNRKLVEVKNFFIDKYGGLSVDSPAEGYWEDNGFIFKDINLEFSIFIPKRKFERQVKKEIPKHIKKFKSDFQQLAILCYYYPVMAN
ncbi:MAG: hypothetical protein WAO91_02700 [Candidatus Nitrosotenuis sp.]